jgi:hypothetical protein
MARKEKDKTEMNGECESVMDEQINIWSEKYKRLFDSPDDDVVLSVDEQIPPDEMDRYIRNYKKWFESEIPIDQKNKNMMKLKKVQAGWKLTASLIDEMAKHIESQLI